MSLSCFHCLCWDFCFRFERWLLFDSIEYIPHFLDSSSIHFISRINVIFCTLFRFISFVLIVRCLSPKKLNIFLLASFWISIPQQWERLRFECCVLLQMSVSLFSICLEKFDIFHLQLMIARPWFVICIDVCHQRIAGTINALAYYTTILFLTFGMLIGDVSFQWCLRT